MSSTSPTSSISEGVLPLVSGGRSARDHRRHLADRGLHGDACSRVRRVRVRRPAVHDPGVPRRTRPTGSRSPSRSLRQQGHRRDPRAAGLHGRLPSDPVGAFIIRDRARHRHAARPQPGCVSHGAEGRHEAGLHGEPHALSWFVARRGRDRQEGARVRASTASASSRSRRSSARCRPRIRPRASSSTRARTRRSSSSSEAPSTSRTRSRRTHDDMEEASSRSSRQRPGRAPTLDNARNLLRSLFFDPKRYDLTKVGRYKLNQRLGVQVPEDVRVLTTEDIVALVRARRAPDAARRAGGCEGLCGRGRAAVP